MITDTNDNQTAKALLHNQLPHVGPYKSCHDNRRYTDQYKLSPKSQKCAQSDRSLFSGTNARFDDFLCELATTQSLGYSLATPNMLS